MKLTEKLLKIDQLKENLSEFECDALALYTCLNNAAKEISNSDRSSFFIFDAKSHTLNSYIAQGLSTKIHIDLGEGIVGNCAQEKKPMIENDVDTTKLFNAEVDLSSGYVTKNTLTMPILDDANNLLGVIQVLNKSLGDYDDRDEQMLMEISKIASKYMLDDRFIV